MADIWAQADQHLADAQGALERALMADGPDNVDSERYESDVHDALADTRNLRSQVQRLGTWARNSGIHVEE